MSEAVVRFMILMQWGRVGSNLIVNIINQSREALLANERFNTIRDAPGQLDWYRQHYQFGSAAPSHRVIGSKENIMTLADRPGLINQLRHDNVRVIRMRRDNVVKAAVSQVRAELYAAQTKAESGKPMWAVRKGSVPLGPTVIKPEDLVWRVEAMERARATLLDAFKPEEVLDIEYDEVLHNLPALVGRVRAALDLPDVKPFRVPFIKATPDGLSEIVSNYGEVYDALSSRGYGRMLQPDEVVGAS